MQIYNAVLQKFKMFKKQVKLLDTCDYVSEYIILDI